MDLRTYEQHKFALAEILRAASATIPAECWDRREAVQDLFTRLAEDRFNLVVVGRFNRGKTSLMNAMMANDRLPTGIVPLTSVITTVSYGSAERAVLKYDDRPLTKEIPIGALPQFITQQGNPGNVQRIKEADVQLPAEILRRGFHFVDTPGLGSAIAESTLTTESYLPEADAFLLVTGYESPLSDDEARFLKAAAVLGRRIFILLNKHDTVAAAEREKVLSFASEQLSALLGEAAPKLFSVSARDALQAKQTHDRRLLAESGIDALERHLLDFLLSEKREQFLLVMGERVADLLREMPSSVATHNLIDRAGEWAGQLSGRAPTPAMPAVEFSGLHQAGACEICAGVREQLWNFICQYQYDLTVSRETQRDFAERGGFCTFHTWEYESAASPYGVCNGYPALLDRLAAELYKSQTAELDQERLLNVIKSLHPASADCVLCRERDKAESNAIRSVATRLIEDAAGTLPALSALCLPHLLTLAAKVDDAGITHRLMQRQAELLQRIAEDMRRNSLKQDGARRFLASAEETAAAQRALLLVAGRRNVNFDSRLKSSGAGDLMNARTYELSE